MARKITTILTLGIAFVNPYFSLNSHLISSALYFLKPRTGEPISYYLLYYFSLQNDALPEFPVLGKPIEPPLEIQRSLSRFRHDHPNPEKVAFIMMEFGETSAHGRIARAIKKELAKHGITGVRADDQQYHDDLHYNVLTYLHGSGFGIAVFERIEGEEFSPNASLEVGSMLALQKPVCLLKDKTLKTLPTDIISKLYRPFDPQHPVRTIPAVLSKWLSDNRMA